MNKEMQGQDEAYISGYMAGQNNKQPEIDALKAENAELSKVKESALRERISLEKRIDALKAELNEVKAAWLALKRENERLISANLRLQEECERSRKDAERYKYLRRWVRGETDRYTEQKTIHFFINPVGDVMKGSVAQHLDEAIDAAMKDFLTQQPEEK